MLQRNPQKNTLLKGKYQRYSKTTNLLWLKSLLSQNRKKNPSKLIFFCITQYFFVTLLHIVGNFREVAKFVHYYKSKDKHIFYGLIYVNQSMKADALMPFGLYGSTRYSVIVVH